MSTLRLLAILTVLAGFDVAATVAVKQAVVKAEPMFMVIAIFCFIAVAGVLAIAIDKTELTVVALGWIILFQVLIVVVDRFMYGVTPGTVETIALVVALLALTVAAVYGKTEPQTRSLGGPKHAATSLVPRPRSTVETVVAERAHVWKKKQARRRVDARVQVDYWSGAPLLRSKR
jgi:predicted membrane channel-forming protein YqfA (hemolysin III family)